ncbi:MAG: 2Fe-2S iron-sulfur cluster binding domain-containing protein [Acetobacteraceae bacterium]|nr:2Fe-2S iron-sulfur cluster binding domain-containing protein [Acetobacteraceae bacterium]
MARTAKSWKVTIGNTGQVVSCARDETILHAAVLAGIDFPYTCASGNCGTCVSKIDMGKVAMLPRGDASLSPEQVTAGMTLACRALPKGDVGVTWLGRGGK